jgi:hypothetical protein
MKKNKKKEERKAKSIDWINRSNWQIEPNDLNQRRLRYHQKIELFQDKIKQLVNQIDQKKRKQNKRKQKNKGDKQQNVQFETWNQTNWSSMLENWSNWSKSNRRKKIENSESNYIQSN